MTSPRDAVTLRAATEADVDAIADLIAATAPLAFDGVGTAAQLEEWIRGLASPETVSARVRDDAVSVIVATTAPALVGTGALYRSPVAPDGVDVPAGFMELGSIYVSARGGGVGGRLVDALCAAAAASGATGVFLETAPNNAAGHALWASRGFSRIGEYRDRRFFVDSTFEVLARAV